MSTVKQKFAAEVGGTFTDIMYLRNDTGKISLNTLKVASTPAAPEQAVIEGADILVGDWSEMGELLHGSTVGTNAILERKGVKAALLVTKGFADVLEIQRGDKEDVYDLFYQRKEPLIPRNMVHPVDERVAASGQILKPLDKEEVRAIAQKLKAQGVESIGICFLHSYAYSEHEHLAKCVLEEELPDAIITCSYEILPQFREYERASTVAISSYISPIMVNYIEKLYGELRERNFDGKIFITQSNGGIIPMDALRKEVARTLLSGPAAGVTGASFMAKQINVDDIISLDIGGTSADVCLVNKGMPLVSTENKLDSSAVAVPMLDIVTVGAGGGSIAWLDNGGMLHVGPQSAGAMPGPACYDRGGDKPTVSDALVYRGFIRPKHFAAGNYPLNVDNARRVIGELAEKMKTTPDELAEAITRIMEANTMHAVRLASTERGYDPRQYTLVAFGGGGALHAANIADGLGIESVLVPCHAGILSSLGLLVADIIRDYVQTSVSKCDETQSTHLINEFRKLKERAVEELTSYGFKEDSLQFMYGIDARYLGQAFELQLDFDAVPTSAEDIGDEFHRVHLERYGRNSLEDMVEIVNYRLRAVIPQDSAFLEHMSYGGSTTDNLPETSKLLIGGEWIECNFYTWSYLPSGALIQGPAIIEDDTSTCFVPRGWQTTVLENGSLLLQRQA